MTTPVLILLGLHAVLLLMLLVINGLQLRMDYALKMFYERLLDGRLAELSQLLEQMAEHTRRLVLLTTRLTNVETEQGMQGTRMTNVESAQGMQDSRLATVEPPSEPSPEVTPKKGAC